MTPILLKVPLTKRPVNGTFSTGPRQAEEQFLGRSMATEANNEISPEIRKYVEGLRDQQIEGEGLRSHDS